MQDAMESRLMGTSVTILGFMRRLTAFALALTCALPAIANANPLLNSHRTDVVLLQSPAWHSLHVEQSLPVLRSPPITDGQAGILNDIWPKLVAYSPQTEYVEPFIQLDLRHGIQYNYHFNFELGARNSDGRGLAVPDGWYQLQMAVIKKSRDSIFSASPTVEDPYSRYVTSTSALVKISGGSFARKISLRFPNITDVALKHHLFIELIPLDNSCKIVVKPGSEYTAPCIRVRTDGSADVTRSTLKPLANYRPYLIEMPFVPLITTGSKLSDTTL